MQKGTIRLDGKKHNIPKCFTDFYIDLESLVGVESVGMSGFYYKGFSKKFYTEIKYYNDTTRTFRVFTRYQGFNTHFYIRVDSAFKEEVERYINNCNNQ